MKISTKAQQALDDMSLGKKHTSLGSDDKTCTESPQTSIIYIYIFFFFSVFAFVLSKKKISESFSKSSLEAQSGEDGRFQSNHQPLQWALDESQRKYVNKMDTSIVFVPQQQ